MMSNDPVFLDSSGWIALLNRTEQDHPAATLAWKALVARRAVVVATDWIIAETGNSLSKTRARRSFARAAPGLIASSNFRLVYVDDDLLSRAIAMYASMQDKSWGLVDCSSFLVMADLGIRDALTADRHFEQAGFRRLLADPGANGPA